MRTGSCRFKETLERPNQAQADDHLGRFAPSVARR
jgi:hypothetical protein